MRQDELSCLVRLSRRTKADSSCMSRRIVRLVPVLILVDRIKQPKNKRLFKLVPDGLYDSYSSSRLYTTDASRMK